MATPDRPASAGVIDRLKETPERFEFFQAVRLLLRAAQQRAAGGAGNPAAQLIGEDSLHDEPLRLGASAHLNFPGAEVASVEAPAEDGSDRPAPTKLAATFLGLIGPSGVLPQHYTQYVLEGNRQKDYAFGDFLNIFHHRALSLFFRIWDKYHGWPGYERKARPARPEDEDLFTSCLYALVGMSGSRMRGRLEFPDEVLLFFSGYFAQQTRNPASLEAMLADFFRVPVEVVSFQGQWLYLSPAEQSVMGSGLGRPAYNELGVNVVVGERVWDVESKVRVRLGPVDYKTFLRFSPLGDRLMALCQLIRSYLRPQFDFDVQPVLLAAEVPGTRLGGSADSASYLGWNSWVHTKPLERDADEAVFSHFGGPTRL